MTSNEPSLAGHEIEHYRVLEELGRGGMGCVYLAEDTRLGRRIALKVIAERVSRDVRGLERFGQEAQILAALNHPNIATIYSLEDADGLHFITMELVRGETLAERLARGRLPLDSALTVCRQVARAVEAAHKQGVVHRDLKPSNIRITPEEHVKVLDFGLAQSIEDDPSESGSTLRDTTLPRGFAGTPGYMSPEQLRGLSIDPRADIWAFGCVAYECLTGSAAFPGESISDRIVATLERDPDWRALPEDTGDRMGDLLRRCLAKSADERPARMREVRQEIEEDLAERRLGLVPASRPPEKASPGVGNLPRRLDSFVGRGEEIDEVRRLLDETFLLSLTGPGGCGKTRLAIEVASQLADDYPEGVWLVELGSLSDPARVPQAVAATLGVKEDPKQELTSTLIEYLAPRKLLLILDNCEHLLASCAALVGTLLERPSPLVVLTTSREALRVAGETVYHVPTLAAPEPNGPVPLEELRQLEAVRLFVDRAGAVQPGFALTEGNAPAISKITGRLDGIPLALELAAARVHALPVEEMAERLDECFCLLTGGQQTSLPKHQTLRALIDWSYDLLTPVEQRLLRRLSVFAGGWTLEAAERVCAGDGFQEWEVVDVHSHLVDKSLVEMRTARGRSPARARYRMLETVRQYAWSRLCERGGEARQRRRHLDCFLELAEEAEPRLRGADQKVWLPRLEVEHDNLQAAFETCAQERMEPELGLRLAAALGRYWMVRGHWSEGSALCRRVLERSPAADGTLARAGTLNAAGNLAFHLGDFGRARTCHEEALAIRRHRGDRTGEANSLNNLGEVARMEGNPALACQFYEQSLSIQKAVDDRWGVAVSLNNLGEVAQSRGDLARARSYHEEALGLWPDIGDRWGLAWSLSNLGFVASRQGRLAEARSFYEKSLDLSRRLGDQFGVALSLHALGNVAQKQEDSRAATAFLEESLAIREKLGDRKGLAESLESTGILRAALGETERGARLLGAAAALRERIHAPAPEVRAEELEREAERIREALGAERFEREWNAGWASPLEEAVREALGGSVPGDR